MTGAKHISEILPGVVADILERAEAAENNDSDCEQAEADKDLLEVSEEVRP